MFTNRPRIRKLAPQIEEFCVAAGIMKRDLAERMGVSNSYVSQILHRGGTKEQIEQVALALEISPWQFDRYHILTFVERVDGGEDLAIAAAFALIEGQSSASKHRTITQALFELAGIQAKK